MGGGTTLPSASPSDSPSPSPTPSSVPKPPAAAARPLPAAPAATASSSSSNTGSSSKPPSPVQEVLSQAQGGQAGPNLSATKEPAAVAIAAASPSSSSAATGAAKAQQEHRPLDVAAGPDRGAERPLSPLPQALGTSGATRIFKALKEQEAAAAAAAAGGHRPARAAGEPAEASPSRAGRGPERGKPAKKQKKGWSLFSSSSRNKKKRRKGAGAASAEVGEEAREGGVSTAVVKPPSSLPTVDELDEPLSVDLLAKKLLRMVDARPECLEVRTKAPCGSARLLLDFCLTRIDCTSSCCLLGS